MRQNLNKLDDLPVSRARDEYESRGLDFDEIVLSRLDCGFVISSPSVFAMGYFYKDGGIVCHLTYVTGCMKTLFRYSLIYDLTFIEFERNFSGVTKRYDFKKFSEKLNGR